MTQSDPSPRRSLTASQRSQASGLLASIIRTDSRGRRYCPHDPTERQIDFLLCEDQEVLYGGSAGGGKTDALLIAALQHIHTPGYSALILRRTFPQLAQPGGLIPRSKEWLASTDAQWHQQDHRWTFPSGATLTFGHLQYDDDIYNYQGAEFQSIGFDELTQFSEAQYTYLMSRLRRIEGSTVPIRMRAASNPGGIGHDWVRDRFDVHRDGTGKRFIPAGLDDNPHLDREAYLCALAELDPITRRQLQYGDWDVRGDGGKFRREWFEILQPEQAPWEPTRIRAWDTASTEKSGTNDPDWTVGLLLARKDGYYTVLDVRRARCNAGRVQDLVMQTAREDGRSVSIRMGQEPGSSGDHMIHDYARKLAGYNFEGIRQTGAKWIRANPVSSAASNRLIRVIAAPWNREFFDELEAFAEDEKSYAHDDQVDALSLAFNSLVGIHRGGPIEITPRPIQTRGQEVFGELAPLKNPFSS